MAKPHLLEPLRAELEAAGMTTCPLDTQIAAHALALGITLVSQHPRAFSRLPGLSVADWMAAR